MIRNLAEWLLAHETPANGRADSNIEAAIRVCEKMRLRLSIFVEADGYRALMFRALMLAKTEFPWLSSMQITEDGGLKWPVSDKPQIDPEESARGGRALAAQLLGLLVVFIGETLTLRLANDIWPDAPLDSEMAERR